MFQQQIIQNKRKTMVVVFAYFILFLLVGIGIGYMSFGNALVGAILAGVAGVLYTFFMISQSTKFVMRMNHAKEITQKEQFPMLWHIVEDMSLVAQVPMPKIYVIEDDSPNAFAAGTSPQTAAVAVTTGLLKRLNRDEIEGVIAHEFAHIKNYDVRLQTIVIALGAVIVFLTQFRGFFYYGGSRSRQSNRKEDSNSGMLEIVLLVVSMIAIIFAPILSTIMRYALSRNREYLADATAVSFTRNPQGLISALEKISTSPSMTQANPESAALYIANPLKKEKDVEKDSLFSTHPTTKNRINRLRNM